MERTILEHTILEHTIYILELLDGRFFVHCQTPDDSDSTIMDNCIQLYHFVNKYRPIKIIDKIPNIELIQIDRYVLQYMEKFGIDSVRGGSYIDEILPDYMFKSLKVQLNTAYSTLVQPKIDKMELLKTHYESIKFFTYEDKQYSINHAFLSCEFKWLYDHIETVNHNINYLISDSDEILQDIIIPKYTQLLIYIKQLPRLYLMVNKYLENDNYHNIDNVFFENANIIFDRYIYNSTIIFPNDTVWKDYYNIMMFFYHTVITHLDEVEFDLLSKATPI